MRKFTLLTALFALFTTAANADTKVIYQDDFTSAETTKASWQTNRAGKVKDAEGKDVTAPLGSAEYWSATATTFQNTSDGNFMQFGDGNLQYNGTRFSTFWGTTPWEGVTIPESGYTMKMSFNFEKFGTNSSNAGQRNNEIAILSTDAAVTNAPVTENFLFKMTQMTTGDAAGQGGYVGNGSCGFYINGDQSKEVRVTEGTWYNVTLNVVGQEVSYSIDDISGNPLANGSYTLAEGKDNRAAGIQHMQARYLGITKIGLLLQISIESDDPVANKPSVSLNQVKGNDRIYLATFADGETLHYILPGSEEQTLDYWDEGAQDEGGNPGKALLTATQSGTLQAWTTKGDAVSDKVGIPVSCGWIKLVDPVVAISSVSEGYGKSYTVTFNNEDATHLLPVEASITYTIDSGESQEIKNGGVIVMDKPGTLVVTVNQTPQAGNEYYERSSVTVQNDVEYECQLDVQYISWDENHFNSNWTASTMEDGNLSHWLGHWMEANKYDKSEQDKVKADPGYTPQPTQNPVKNYRTDVNDIKLPYYLLTNDEDGVNYATELLPLIPRKERGWVCVLLEEGIIENYLSGGSGTNKTLEFNFDTKWISDDASKPNFMEIRKTNNYDRYDKDGRHITDIVPIVEPAKDQYNYYLDINNTAIHSARVFTYKGFTTGIEAVKTVAPAVSADAPIYNLSGVRVANANQKGIYIQNGKKFVVK